MNIAGTVLEEIVRETPLKPDLTDERHEALTIQAANRPRW